MIDTNVLVSRFLSPTGIPAQIFHLWRETVFEVVVSESVLSEYQRVLGYEHIRARHQMSDAEIADVLLDLRRFSLLVAPQGQVEVIGADPEDNKFLECAVAGSADYIISGDLHLLQLKAYRGIQILAPAAFIALITLGK
ncbi:MAG: putative toxin-antitoxin system toxin component, PIN family [Chloroflexi bacterium]|nr:putative toxin-antitoxin system toxin component, PIN family [Chloroflexota bacterium]